MRRCSPTLMCLRAFDALKVYLPFMLLQGNFAARLPPFLGLPWFIFLVYYSMTRIKLIFFDWLTVRYQVTDEGIAYRSGWPGSITTRIRWADAGALQVDQDFIHQLLRRDRVRVVTGADAQAALELDALDAATVLDLRARHSRSATDTPSRGRLPASPNSPPRGHRPPEEQVVYRARWRDYLLISLGYGQFFLLVPFLLGAWSDVAESVGLEDGTAVLDHVVAGDATVWGVFVAGALAFGAARAAITYQAYRVTRDADGFEATGGLLHRSARRARLGEIRGVRIEQNPLMCVLRMWSLSLVLDRARGEFHSLVVLPMGSRAGVDRIVRGLLPAADLDHAPRANTPRGLAAGILLTGGAVTAALMAVRLPWVAAAVCLITFITLNHTWLAFEPPTHTPLLRHRRGLVWRREYVVDASAVRSLEMWRRELPRPSRHIWSRLTFMDRRAVSLWLPPIDPLLMGHLGDRLVAREHEEQPR